MRPEAPVRYHSGLPFELSMLPPELVEPGRRKLPRWGPTLPHTFAVLGVGLIFASLPLSALFAGLFGDGENKIAMLLVGVTFGLPMVALLAFQQVRAWRRRALYQWGELAKAAITRVTRHTRNGATMSYRFEYAFDVDGRRFTGSVNADHLELGNVPFVPGDGDQVVAVFDPARPSRNEAFGFGTPTGRWWIPGA